jgi:JAB1/Mov34/MPN/PAD-1 ubiquitin protease
LLSSDISCDAAVPFEEDSKDPTIWFIDHSYMENMSRMFRKVNGADPAWTTVQIIKTMRTWVSARTEAQATSASPAPQLCMAAPVLQGSPLVTCAKQQMCVAAREYIVGWYSTGPKLRASDLDINDLMSSYCSDPVLVITEVQVRSIRACRKALIRAASRKCTSCGHVSQLKAKAALCQACSYSASLAASATPSVGALAVCSLIHTCAHDQYGAAARVTGLIAV